MSWKFWQRPVVVENHTHDWKVIGATYQGPPHSASTWGFTDQATINHLLHGTTVLTQECQVCHRIDTTRRAGRVDLSAHGWEWDS